LAKLRRLLIGAPIATSQASHERLSPFFGLPVFSSDALSSVAYATEAILGILILKSTAGDTSLLNIQIWISAAIVALIFIVAISYNQTIHAYPNGGGSYIVASENLGETCGLIAGAALLVDYVLTVSVSVAAGVAAIVSAYQNLNHLIVPISLACIAVVAWANLRGVKESGVVFAIPTYGFVGGLMIVIVLGAIKVMTSHPVAQQVYAMDANNHSLIGTELSAGMLFIVLRAFAAGCTALTGIEAVSNGVQAFKAPEADNASKTLRWMACLLAIMFIGVSLLALRLPVLTLHDGHNSQYETVLSQIAKWTFGGKNNLGYQWTQWFTALILILAANTAFADFPRLSSLLARDGFMPRQLSRQGDRLVFHNGIVALAIASGAIVVLFGGTLDNLLPLYAVGVFTAFTLSQFGMVVHWNRLREGSWKRGAVINSIGATLTLIVLGIILVTKWRDGAWIVTILLAVLFASFKIVKSTYGSVTRQLALSDAATVKTLKRETTVLLINRVHKGVLFALDYARATGLNLHVVHVAINRRALPEVQSLWEQYGGGIPLEVINAPYRSLINPVLAYIDRLLAEDPDQFITVVVPEAYSNRLLNRLLQETVAAQLKAALGKRKNVVVTNVRYIID